MYERALQGYEKAWGPDHTSTLDTVNNLGNIYKDQGRLKEAEAMYQQALQGKEKALGPDAIKTYIPALNTLENLGSLFKKLGENNAANSDPPPAAPWPASFSSSFTISSVLI
ncbi:hypothetical protein EsH8_XI_000072 [Colletotrichum jinshuiense]